MPVAVESRVTRTFWPACRYSAENAIVCPALAVHGERAGDQVDLAVLEHVEALARR